MNSPLVALTISTQPFAIPPLPPPPPPPPRWLGEGLGTGGPAVGDCPGCGPDDGEAALDGDAPLDADELALAEAVAVAEAVPDGGAVPNAPPSLSAASVLNGCCVGTATKVPLTGGAEPMDENSQVAANA